MWVGLFTGIFSAVATFSITISLVLTGGAVATAIVVDSNSVRLYEERYYIESTKKITTKEIAEYEYAYIVISTNDQNVFTQWTNIKQTYDNQDNSLYDMFIVSNTYNEDLKIYKINPDKYTLTGAVVDLEKSYSYTRYSGLNDKIRRKNEENKNTEPLLASFEV